jgi:hypothetical protein
MWLPQFFYGIKIQHSLELDTTTKQPALMELKIKNLKRKADIIELNATIETGC